MERIEIVSEQNGAEPHGWLNTEQASKELINEHWTKVTGDKLPASSSARMMKCRFINTFILLGILVLAGGYDISYAQEKNVPAGATGVEYLTVPAASEVSSDWLKRETLTGDWGGARTTLKEHGITIKPRFTQFYQGQSAGYGEDEFFYGSKLDLMVNTDLSKLGTWDGLSFTTHLEYNFGRSVNGSGRVLVPVNTALLYPGMEGPDAFDLSSVYLAQTFGKSVSLILGKVNMIDLAARLPFRGGAGVDSFWSHTFVVAPTGIVPPYLFGALMSIRTEPATYGLWVYDPNSMMNKTGFERPFADGVSIRGNIDIPVTIFGLSGHQGFAAAYSNEPGTDLETLGELFLPPAGPSFGVKNDRYYFAYVFDQYLYRSKEDPDEGVGVFGQYGVSDGNPNKLEWSLLVGVGGTGLIPGRSLDNWGIGYYQDSTSTAFRKSLAPVRSFQNEQGVELFYNFAVTPWFTVGADFQIIVPGLKKDEETAYFPGIRSVVRF